MKTMQSPAKMKIAALERRLASAEEEITRYLNRLQDAHGEREALKVTLSRVNTEKNSAWDLFMEADQSARAVPYLMDMIADLQGQIANLTGGDDPARDIAAPVDADAAERIAHLDALKDAVKDA